MEQPLGETFGESLGGVPFLLGLIWCRRGCGRRQPYSPLRLRRRCGAVGWWLRRCCRWRLRGDLSCRRGGGRGAVKGGILLIFRWRLGCVRGGDVG
jgi:hypothetical protein